LHPKTQAHSGNPFGIRYDLPIDNSQSGQTIQSGKANGNPQDIYQTDTPSENPADASLHGRLHFDRKQTVPVDKPEPQQGTAYYQRFNQDAPRPPERQPAPQAGGSDVKNILPSIPSPQDVPVSRQTAPSEKISSGAPKPGRLQFAPEERATQNKKLAKAQQKAEKTADRLDKVRNRLPAKKKTGKERIFDEKKNKYGHKIRFEAEVKPQQSHLKDALPLRPAKAGANLSIGYAHNKLFQVERENVGTQAAHKGELLAEGGLRTAYRLHKTAPYRRVAKLERLSAKHNAKLAYQKLLHENPRLRTNLLSRFIQKQKIKRRYAKAARESKQAAQLMKQAGAAGGKIIKLASGFVRSHPMVIGGIALLLLMVFSFSTLLTSCTNMAMGGFSSVLMSSYTAEDEDIDDAELTYTEWETNLLMRIQNAQAEHPGYDEYRYNVDDISHNPFELMAYLSAKYQDFTFATIKTELQRISNEQYRLEFVAQTEIRYRTETRTDPETGESYTVEVPYEWHILNINLTSKSFTDVVQPNMNADEREMYGLNMQTKGNRQYITSPFDFDWIPYVTCYYGWRIHPVTGAKDYHKGIDIGVPVGTDILAGHDGKVIQAAFDAGGYGYYIAIEGKDGLVSKYAHCDRLLASVGQQVKKGDVIAKSGNTGRSTGPHLHLEVLKNGRYLNPLFFAETPDSANDRQ
jgi:murein DD-endopeptidase MepM/ murein hydrolase activator NlpD